MLVACWALYDSGTNPRERSSVIRFSKLATGTVRPGTVLTAEPPSIVQLALRHCVSTTAFSVPVWYGNIVASSSRTL